MADHERHRGEPRRRRNYEQGLYGYHDPVGRYLGAPPGLSALTPRLWLAGFGFVFCAISAGAVFILLPPLAWLGWSLTVLAILAAVDFAWVVHRKRRGEPG